MNGENDNADDMFFVRAKKNVPKLSTKFPVTLSIIDSMIENSYIVDFILYLPIKFENVWEEMACFILIKLKSTNDNVSPLIFILCSHVFCNWIFWHVKRDTKIPHCYYFLKLFPLSCLLLCPIGVFIFQKKFPKLVMRIRYRICLAKL